MTHDLISPEKLEELSAYIQTVKVGTRILHSQHGQVPLPLILDVGLTPIDEYSSSYKEEAHEYHPAHSHDHDRRTHHHHEHHSNHLENDGFVSVSFQSDRPFNVQPSHVQAERKYLQSIDQMLDTMKQNGALAINATTSTKEKIKSGYQICSSLDIAILNESKTCSTLILNYCLLVISMENFLLEQQQVTEKISILTEFIESNPDARELKRALAVKLALQGTLYAEISKLLGMHKSCISKWKQKFEIAGLDGIKLGYQGSKSYLSLEQRAEVITWLQTKEYINIEELFTYLETNYDVTYRSKQSYYELLSVAGISWKKSQSINPRFNPELVKKKREKINEFLSQHQAEIKSGQLVVFFLDECHLLGDDICGYVWGRTDTRIEIPVKNLKSRQTYYGALDYQTQEFIVREYSAGNSDSTVKFIQELQAQRPGRKIALIWDGVGYHKSDEVKNFLASVNDNHQSDQWQITCILFAPNAPEQNPVEDVWLQAKNFLRKFWPLCKSFSAVKWLFKFFTNHQQFDFPKLHQYASCL